MPPKTKKEKSRISRLIEKSDSDNEEQAHELSFYVNDRVKLMKEVLKIIKPKKIKSMAPDCIKDLDIEELNSMLLEELLGISNKRLKYIFNGQNLDEDTSSTDPEEEQQPVIDIISLDDVSDDEFDVIEIDPVKPTKKKKHGKIKEEPKDKKIKKEKTDKSSKKKGPLQEENLMSVLELLELQARARAIRSQLLLEASKKVPQQLEGDEDKKSDNDDVIIEIPKNEEIVIDSSDSEKEQQKESNTENPTLVNAGTDGQKKKIKLVRDRLDKEKSPEKTPTRESENITLPPQEEAEKVEETNDSSDLRKEQTNENGREKEESTTDTSNQQQDEDEIILIVDQAEMDGIIGD